MKRFKQLREEFYCLAWTTLTMESNETKSRTNVLAVGGFNGHLRLLQPAQLVCYAEHGDGRPNRTVNSYYYNCLAFHTHRPTWLFCGSSDTTITLFDIGIPHGADYKTEITQLLILITSRPAAILNMVISTRTNHLVAGTENGCFAWDIDTKTISSSRGVKQRREPSMELGLPVTGKPFVDGLVLVDSNFVACKCAGDGYIYVLNLTNALCKQRAGRVYGFEWTKTDTKYISLGSANGLLACGDDRGSIWLYNIKSILSSQQTHFSKFLSPSRILVWPQCVLDETSENAQKMVDVLEEPEPLVINYLSISNSGEFIVAGTDCNLVCIWKRTK
jgi:WD40 repeat protein